MLQLEIFTTYSADGEEKSVESFQEIMLTSSPNPK